METVPRAGSAPPNLMLAALTSCGLLALTAYAPAMPLIVSDLGVPVSQVQLTMTLYFLVLAAGQLIAGPLSDLWGRKPVALAGMALFTLGSLLGALAGGIETLLAARLMQALGGAAGSVLARAIVKDVFPGDQVARALTRVVMISALVPIAGPVAGGALAHALGWRAILWVLAGFSAAVFLGLILTFRETAPRDNRRPLRAYAGIYRDLLINRPFLRFSLNAGAFAMAYFSFLSGMPVAVTAASGISAAEFGRWFALMPAAYLVGNAASSRLLRVHDAGRLLRAGSLLSTAGAAAMLAAYLTLPPSPAAVFLPALLLTAGHGMAMASATALTLNTAPSSPGTAVALMGALNMGCAGLGTMLVAQPGIGTVVATILVAQLAALALTAWPHRD